MKRRAAAVALLLAFAGCGNERAATDTPRRAHPRATAAPPAQTVSFTSKDGERIEAQYRPARKNAPAIVLMHEIRGGPDEWEPLLPDLHAAGFATLAYQSPRGSPVESDRLPDTLAAIRWLQQRHTRIGLVGASIGASTAVYAAAKAKSSVAAAVALSPPDTPDVWKLQEAGRYRPHDLLLVSDDREAPSADAMLEGAVDSKSLRSTRPGHGIDLLADAKVRDVLLAWLRERV